MATGRDLPKKSRNKMPKGFPRAVGVHDIATKDPGANATTPEACRQQEAAASPPTRTLAIAPPTRTPGSATATYDSSWDSWTGTATYRSAWDPRWGSTQDQQAQHTHSAKPWAGDTCHTKPHDGSSSGAFWPAPRMHSLPAAAAPRPLVLVLGMPKCGTTSLHEAFKSVGFNSIHWACNAGADQSADKRLRETGADADRRLVSLLMHRAVAEGLPPLSHLPAGVDAVAEMNGLVWRDRARGLVEGSFPQMSLLEDLAAHYPHAHFVLNVRDARRWVASVDGHNDMRRRLVCAELPGLAAGAGQKDEELVEWVQSHYRRVQSFVGGRGARLLVFDIERHGEKELSAFLGRKVTWGHHNVTYKW